MAKRCDVDRGASRLITVGQLVALFGGAGWALGAVKGWEMERSRGITVYGRALIIMGAYNLLTIGSYKQFCFMFRPLVPILIAAIYLFTVVYGVCSVYCGVRILKLEDWARKMMVGLTSLSVLLGLFLNRTVMVNFKEFLLSDGSGVTVDMVGALCNYTVVIIALVTMFELSVVYYFTRPAVVGQFLRTKKGY